MDTYEGSSKGRSNGCTQVCHFTVLIVRRCKRWIEWIPRTTRKRITEEGQEGLVFRLKKKHRSRKQRRRERNVVSRTADAAASSRGSLQASSLGDRCLCVEETTEETPGTLQINPSRVKFQVFNYCCHFVAEQVFQTLPVYLKHVSK